MSKNEGKMTEKENVAQKKVGSGNRFFIFNIRPKKWLFARGI